MTDSLSLSLSFTGVWETLSGEHNNVEIIGSGGGGGGGGGGGNGRRRVHGPAGRDEGARAQTEEEGEGHLQRVANIVFHYRDFPFPISRDPDDFFFPAFPENRSGIPGNRIY
jgi:hypothetical protein